ncbi:hypothetical protein B0H13DRAFT_1884354 [Mycena leptocephala]|nr:hypothetical protein B0H13DRAFT_1884354 [Mycena leptocephala]
MSGFLAQSVHRQLVLRNRMKIMAPPLKHDGYPSNQSLGNGLPEICNTSTFWLVTNTVIFFQSGLDSGRTYVVSVINLGGGAMLSLSSTTVVEIFVGSCIGNQSVRGLLI